MSLTYRDEMMQKLLALRRAHRNDPEVARRFDAGIIAFQKLGGRSVEHPSMLDQDADLSAKGKPATVLPQLDDFEYEQDLAPFTASAALCSCSRYMKVTWNTKIRRWRTFRNCPCPCSCVFPRTAGEDRSHISMQGLRCKDNSGSIEVRNSGPWARLSGLMVIDCFSRRVVMASPGCEYVALSYVWGSGGSGQETFESDLRGRRLPQTVEDAMNVVRVLGMQFLWVDRYCINKSEPATKHHMISNMDAIYETADLVIIAAAGADGEYGLPSVSRTIRGTRNAGTIPPWSGDFWPQLSYSQSEQVRNSAWSTRGWTYQEGLLCLRQLIFTDIGVSHNFELNHCAWTSSGIYGHINDYCQRTLTYPSDSLNAFLGVFRAYERLQPPTLHVWGIPFCFVSGDVQFDVVTSGDIWQPGYGLLWKTSRYGFLRPIPELPSWTWAGWSGWSARCQPGPYDWLIRNAPPDGSRAWFVSDIDIEVLVDDRLRNLHEHFHTRRRLSSIKIEEPAPVLYITAWSTTVRFGYSKAGVAHVLGTDVVDVNLTVATTPDSLYMPVGDQQSDGHLRCQWTVAVICWGVRSAMPTLIKRLPTQSLLLERVGQDTFRRIGVLETNWHKSDLDKQGRIAALGRTFTRTRLCIV